MSCAIATGDGIYAYESMKQDASAEHGGRNDKGGPRYPAENTTWTFIRRYLAKTGQGGAGFAAGAG